MENSEKKHYRSCFRRIVAQEVIINLLTEQQAAHKYHVSRIFVRRWIRCGSPPGYKQNYVEPYLLPTMKSKKDASEQDRIKQLEKKRPTPGLRILKKPCEKLNSKMSYWIR